MRIYLVQHGKPVPKEENPERPLSDVGRKEVTRLAEILKAARIKPKQIFHSGKLRAQQTAQILSSIIAQGLAPKKKEHISPLDDPAKIASEIPAIGDGTMLVGHLPHLEKLASLLVTGDPTKTVAKFQQGGVLCLEQTEEGQWAIVWLLIPELFPSN